MPLDLPIDQETGDLNIVNGDITLVDGAEAVRQRLSVKLRTFLGEWFDDPTFGVPYKENVFTKPTRIQLIHATFVQAILTVPGVQKFIEPLEFDFNRSTRLFNISFAVQTDSGIVEINNLQVP